MFLDRVKKLLKSIKMGGLRSRPILYYIYPPLQHLHASYLVREEKRDLSVFEPKTVLLSSILTDSSPDTIVQVHCSTKIKGLSRLVLTIDKSALTKGLKMFQLQYEAFGQGYKINAEPLKEIKGVVLHTAVTRDTITDIAFENMVLRGWSAIGYHFVILLDGTIVSTRPLTLRGDHAYGFNDSIGICFARNLTKEHLSMEEIRAGRELLLFLKKQKGELPRYTHQTAQLEAVKQQLQGNSGYEKWIAQITELQQRILINPLSATEIKAHLNELIRCVSLRSSELKIGKFSLAQYIKDIKDCPGKKFNGRDFL